MKASLIVINAVGGSAVLLSYVYGFVAHPDEVGLLWGGVPAEWRGLYTTAMFPAALGYFPMTFFLLFKADLRQDLFAGVQLGPALTVLYLGVMVGSALWMPLTFLYIAGPSGALWAAVWLVLAIVGLSSLSLIAILLKLRPEPPSIAWRLALLGSLFFAFQTAVLDACVWPSLFVIP